MGAATCIEVLLAIILPPVGVFLRYGCGLEFWICLLLTVLGYIPGILSLSTSWLLCRFILFHHFFLPPAINSVIS